MLKQLLLKMLPNYLPSLLNDNEVIEPSPFVIVDNNLNEESAAFHILTFPLASPVARSEESRDQVTAVILIINLHQPYVFYQLCLFL
jgi:hypothetical protein